MNPVAPRPPLELIERIRAMAKNYPLRLFLMAGASKITVRRAVLR